MDSYAIVLSEAAAMTLATATRREQRKLAVILENMKTSPFRRGDLQESDARGRTNEVLVVDDWLVTYWSDHAGCEMRIVRLERIDD